MSYESLNVAGLRRSWKEVKPSDSTDLVNIIENYAGDYIIQIPAGTYTPATTIDLSGIDDEPDDYRGAIIKGAGVNQTIINGTAGQPTFKFNNAIGPVLQDMTIDRPAHANAEEAILGDDDGVADSSGVGFPATFKRLMITGGNASTTLPAVTLKDVFRWGGFEDCWIHSYGDDIVKFEYTAAGNYKLGDADLFRGFNHFRQRKAGADIDNCTNILHFEGQDTDSHIANIRNSGRVELWSSDTVDYVCAIRVDYGKALHLRHVHSEKCKRIVQAVNDVQFCSLGDCGYLALHLNSVDGIYFDFSADTSGFQVLDINRLYVPGTVTATLVNDANVTSARPNMFRNVHIREDGTLTMGTGLGYTGGNTKFTGIWGNARSENSGTGTIANGTPSINITHGLFKTPQRVFITGTTNDTDACELVVSAKAAATFTVRRPAGNVTGNITFDWIATVDNQAYFI